MKKSLKIVIPMAGFGTRLRPHTWSRPKQLVSLAGKSVLAHVLDSFSTLPDPENVEFIFIVGYLGNKVETYMREHYPELKVQYVVQKELRGQSHAIYLSKEHLSGPMLMIFVDTLVETDFSFLAKETAGGVAWVKRVPDPRRFGVAEVGENGWVTRMIEKPQDMSNNLAAVGFYYFADSGNLIAAIEEQMRRDVQLKGEYFLVDAINIMLEDGMQMRIQEVDVWLDAGTPEAVLQTNRYLLEHGCDNTAEIFNRQGISVISPVFIHPHAEVEASVIGPHTSIGAGCKVRGCVIRNSILEDGTEVANVVLEGSLLGENSVVRYNRNVINVGDNSVLEVGQ